MTLDEFKEKIAQLEFVKNKATGLKAMELMDVISDLTVKVAEHETSFLTALEEGVSAQYFEELESITNTFKTETEALANRNELIDNTILIGKKIIALL
jgi:hypothetical protein